MTPFAFRTAGQILFGSGEFRRAPELAARFGRRVFLVTGGSSLERSGALGVLTSGLDRLGIQLEHWRVAEEPTVEVVDAGAAACRGCSVVLAVGGGSVLDAGKAIAALATNPGSVLDYLEEVGTGRIVEVAPLPVIAVPTTAGSGSEVTRNSVIRAPAASVKRSLRSDWLLPRFAVVDPELAASAPVPIAAAAGLDALTHLIESYVCLNAQPMTDAYALPGIRLAAAGLQGLADGTGGGDQRSLASLWGGICLANAGLGAVHGLAAPLGGTACIAHGVACACLLPATVRVNVEALQQRAPESPALARYEEVFRAVNPANPTAAATADALDGLRRGLWVPSLTGLRPDQLEGIVAGSRGGSMRANPIVLTDAELSSILTSA